LSGGSIEYYAIDGVPGRYFKCPKGVGKLSDKSCGKLYIEAMSPKGLREGLRFQCRGCPVGAEHSGSKRLDAASSGLLSGLICARCIRQAPRLIRGTICVSCYNREREVLIGKNAKGNRPVHGRQIGPEIVAFKSQDSTRVKQIDRASSHIEAVLSTIRSEAQRVQFSWPAAPILGGGRATRTV
jgi:hypothetical protein